MSVLIANPEMVVAAAADLESIRSELTYSYAAASPATNVAAAAADEVSSSVAAMFASFGRSFQGLGSQAAVFHDQFVQQLTAAARAYGIAEALNASPLAAAAQQARSAVSAAGEQLLGVGGGGTASTATPASTASATATSASGPTATYAVTSQWNSGFNAGITIRNPGSTPLTNWQLQFTLPTNESVVNLWNGQVTHVGTLYTVTPASYNTTIAPGGSVTVGFQAGQTGAYSAPTHVLVNGQVATGGGTTGGGTTGGGTTGGGTAGGGTTGGTAGGGTTGGGTTGGGTAVGGTTGAGVSGTYAVTSQWNNGFVANYTITNSSATPVTNWQVQFTLPSNESITSAWNGQLAQAGTQVTLTPQSYDATIAPGGSVVLGFQAAQTGSYSAPTHFVLGAVPVTTGGGATGGGPIGGGTTGGGTTGGGTTGGGTTGGGTTGGGTAGGGTVITAQYGKATIENAYIVQNNGWNIGGSQQAITVTPTGFAITTETGTASTSGAPLAYPSVYMGWHYGTASPGSPLPVQLNQVTSAVSSINYTYPSSGVYDASYDLWLNPTPITTGVNQQEIMVWLNHVGPIQPVGSQVGTTTINGRAYSVWSGYNGQNQTVSYVANTPISSWNNENLLSFINNAEVVEASPGGGGNGLSDSWYLTSIQAGFEPWSGSVGAAVSNFSASVNGVS